MWTNLIVALLALSPVDAASFRPPTPASWSRTRPLSPSSAALLALAAEKSSIVRDLLWRLEQTDVVAYLTDVIPGAMRGPGSYLVFLSREEGARYVLIRIDLWPLPPSERISLLGHELQHALEVAGEPAVKDAASMADLYRRIGWEGRRDQFETKAARTIGHRILSQLSGQSL